MLSNTEMGSFFENIGMMIKAGISVNEAVDLLREESEAEKPRLVKTYEKMSEDMHAGSSLEMAMKESGQFPEYAVDMIGASEYTGRLEDTLFHLAEYYRTEHSMKNIFVSAVRYPIILLVMVIAVLAAMLTMVFPVFDGVYENLTGSLAASSYDYIHISFAFCRVLLIVMIILVAVLITGVLMWRGGKRAQVKSVLSRLSTFRQMFLNLDLYRFTTCFDMYMAGGEMQEEDMKKSMSIVKEGELRNKLERCAEKMDAGLSFAQVALEEKLYDPINNRMLMPAERSGMLDQVMEKIKNNLKENNEKYVGRIAGTVEPLLTGFLMITIGLMLISLMVPLVGIMNSIG